MFQLSPAALRAIRTDDLRQSEDELGKRVFRTRDGGDAIRAMEAGKRPISPLVACAVIGFQTADRIASGHVGAGGYPATAV